MFTFFVYCYLCKTKQKIITKLILKNMIEKKILPSIINQSKFLVAIKNLFLECNKLKNPAFDYYVISAGYLAKCTLVDNV